MQAKPLLSFVLDQTVKEEVLILARQSYENVRNCWNGEECFSCSLMHQFCENLIHLHCKEVTQLLRRKIDQHFNSLDKTQTGCINNQFCYNFDSLQWKNNQQISVLSMLENVLTTMIESKCKSSSEEREQTLLDIEYDINCACPKCKERGVRSDRVIEDRKAIAEELGYSSLKQITECVRYNKIRISPEKKLDKIFNLLKDERKQLSQSREAKKHKNQLIFGLYGNLLGLDCDKYMDDCCYEELQKKRVKIYDELLKKNSMNERYIRRFSRKVSLKKNQAKIHQRGSINDSTSTADFPSSKTIQTKSQKMSNLSTPPFTSRLLNRTGIISKDLPNKKTQKSLAPISSIQQAKRHYSKIQESVEKALKSFQPREEKRTFLLKSIVFNPTDVFLTQRKPQIRPNIDRPYFNRFQKALKASREVSKFTFRRSIDEISKKFIST